VGKIAEFGKVKFNRRMKTKLLYWPSEGSCAADGIKEMFRNNGRNGN